jgi:site-specific recombinase XerD
LRLIEGLCLRMKDVHFELKVLRVHEEKGDKDRIAVLPHTLIAPLQSHLETTRHLRQREQSVRVIPVWMPHALARRYPRAAHERKWQDMFPTGKTASPRCPARPKPLQSLRLSRVYNS